jgi:Mg2+/Co2+ transporter CorB
MLVSIYRNIAYVEKSMKRRLILLILLTMVFACEQSKDSNANKDHVFKAQEQALKKAKEVEDVLEKAQQDRRKQIEDTFQK